LDSQAVRASDSDAQAGWPLAAHHLDGRALSTGFHALDHLLSVVRHTVATRAPARLRGACAGALRGAGALAGPGATVAPADR